MASKKDYRYCFNCRRPSDLTEFRKYEYENAQEVPLLKKFSIFLHQESENRSIEKYICDECRITINGLFSSVETIKKTDDIVREFFVDEVSTNTNLNSNMPVLVKFENSLNEEKPGDSLHAGRSDETLDEVWDKIENFSFNRKRRNSIGESEYGSSVNLQQLPIVSFPNDLEDIYRQYIRSSCPSPSLSPSPRRSDLIQFDFSNEDNEPKRRRIIKSRKSLECEVFEELDTMDNTSEDPNYETVMSQDTFMNHPTRGRSRSRRNSGENRRCKSPAADVMYQCEICFKSYKKYWYKNHLKIHNKAFDITCELCDRKFKLKAYLNKHLKIHGNISDIRCAACPEVFKGIQVLKEHLLTQHENLFKTGVCNICSKNCYNAVNLNSHVSKHHSDY